MKDIFLSSKTPKIFQLLIKCKQINISVYRLKPAYILQIFDNEIQLSTLKTDWISVTVPVNSQMSPPPTMATVPSEKQNNLSNGHAVEDECNFQFVSMILLTVPG